MFDTVSILKKLYAEGGMDIYTPFKINGNEGSEDEEHLLIHSVFQPDADIITYLPQTVLDRPEIWDTGLKEAWEAHLEKTREMAHSIRRFRKRVRSALSGVGILGVVFSLKGLCDYYTGQEIPYFLVSGLGMSVFPFGVKMSGGTLVRYCLKRKMKSV